MDFGLHIFDTPIGPCGIAWGPRGVTAVSFPERDVPQTEKRLRQKCPQARTTEPPPHIRSAIDDIVALLSGEKRDLAHIAVDDSAIPEFNRRVYALARTIPPGQTRSYGEIAKALGDPLLARDVGQALGQNPTPIIVPCHRVLAANGKTGGFSAPGGVDTKMRVLTIERAQPGGPTLFDDLPLARKRTP
jgi:methylated-DNA-[protein]-cysteine S-methyltransferase